MLAVLESGVQISGGCVLPFAFQGDVAHCALYAIVGIQVLQILDFRPANLRCGFDKIILRPGGTECTAGYVDWTVVAMPIFCSGTVVRLEL